jgi:hypothetical protein
MARAWMQACDIRTCICHIAATLQASNSHGFGWAIYVIETWHMLACMYGASVISPFSGFHRCVGQGGSLLF